MKALTINMERILELKQKIALDQGFKPAIHDLLEFGDVPELPLVNDDWIKIQVKLGGICGTDLSFLSLRTSTVLSNFSSFPAVPGHEIVGTVVEKGDNTDNISIGDRVIIDESLGCEVRGLESCENCKIGNYNLCSNYDKGNISPGAITGFCKDTGGAWGENVVAHKSQVFNIPEAMSFEEALIAEPLACAIHGVFQELPGENDNCVVVGCGTIGLATIIALKAFSKCNVIAVAKYAFQSEMARKLGADDVYLVKKDIHVKKIGRKLGCRILNPVMEDAYPIGGGADIVIDTVGNASSLSNCLRLVKPTGTLILIGYPAYIEIDWTPIMAKEIKIVASNIFTSAIVKGKKTRTMQVALDLIASGKADVKGFLTHMFSIEKYKEGLDVASNKNKHEAIKVAFSFE